MKKFLIFATILCSSFAVAQDISIDNLKKHVYVLASDSLAGRKAGTPTGRKATTYIVNSLSDSQINAKTDTSLMNNGESLINVRHIFQGNDPKLRDELILVIAHYDHIGVDQNGKIYPGANDNATSVAALLEMARQWSPTKRSVMFIWSDGEELGILGTKSFVKQYPENIKQIKLVISSEMLGYYDRTNSFVCMGVNMSQEADEILKVISTSGLNLVTENPMESIFLRSTDTAPFIAFGIPVMVWTTPSMDNLHRPTDAAELIDYATMTEITKHLYNSLQAFANCETITATEAAKNEIKK